METARSPTVRGAVRTRAREHLHELASEELAADLGAPGARSEYEAVMEFPSHQKSFAESTRFFTPGVSEESRFFTLGS